MDQFFINFFSWVDIHDIYYILKIYNQIWWYNFNKNIPFLASMTHNWTKIWLKLSKKCTKYVINGYVYVEKISQNLKLSMPYNIGVATLSRSWCSTWLWSETPPLVPLDEKVNVCEKEQNEAMIW